MNDKMFGWAVLALALVTNETGVSSPQTLTHQDVLDSMLRHGERVHLFLDGILTGLLLLDSLLACNRTLEGLLDEIVPYPQVQLNVKVREKPDMRRHPTIAPAVSRP